MATAADSINPSVHPHHIAQLGTIVTMPPPSKPNLTGFDPRKFAAASGHVKGDPWARYEAWRYTGPFSRWNRFKGSFPGLGIATVAFAGYLVYEQLFLQKEHHHGEEHH